MASDLGAVVSIAVMLTLSGALHLYLWRCLVVAPRLRSPLRWMLAVVIVLFALLVPLKFAFTRPFERDNLFPLQPVVWTWLAFVFYQLLVFVPADLIGLARRWRSLRSEKEHDAQGVSTESPEGRPLSSPEEVTVALDRRAFVARAVAAPTLMAAGAVTTYGVARANGDFHLPEVNVSLSRLPRALEGFKIVHLSDIHIGPVLDGRFVDHLVESTNKLRPDLVCITGDVVDGAIADIGPAVARLAKLKATYGVAFTTGNHEYYSGAGPWLHFFKGLGFHVLENERLRVGDANLGGASFDLAGIHDRQGARFHSRFAPSLDKALEGRDPERELVLMAHQPAQIAMAEGRGVGLQLSGHTHGGQIWPFGAVTRLLQPYLQGLSRHHDGTQIYVSCGAGYWGPPLRVGAPPEIASVILTG